MIRKGMISVFDQAIVSGTNFATALIVARMCPREELGIYYLGLSVVFFVRDIQEQIISAPYVVHCHHYQGRRLASYGGSMLMHQWTLSAAAVTCLLGLIGVLSLGFGSPGLVTALWAMLVVVPVLLLRDCIRQFTFAHLRLGTAVAIDATVSVLQLGSLLLLAHFEMVTAAKAYLVMGGACATASLGWFLSKRQPLRLVPARFAADWRQNWTFGRWTLASQLVGCTTPFVLPWLLAMASGEAETGMFAACATLVGITNVFLLGVANFLTPKAAGAFAKGGLDDLRCVLRKAVALVGVPVGMVCLLALVAGDQLLALVYGGKFAGGGQIVVALAFAALANSLGVVAGNGLWAIKRPQACLAADVCVLAVTLPTAIYLVHPFGALGIATATMAGIGVGTLVRWVTLMRCMESIHYELKQPGEQPA